ncbi:hypothetical protein F442_13107 [Phytophthora nicotianae P10297]|uniref:RxLR effector protein n=1 Tax=Phytophthora nicotianae P10297 TaxID=1317064 RepID=W2YWA6_PHYNI|nr:hypothetical protein F442_13107 [Phytophthora nicotianae P10297]
MRLIYFVTIITVVTLQASCYARVEEKDSNQDEVANGIESTSAMSVPHVERQRLLRHITNGVADEGDLGEEERYFKNIVTWLNKRATLRNARRHSRKMDKYRRAAIKKAIYINRKRL